jgi:hypothetical protein
MGLLVSGNVQLTCGIDDDAVAPARLYFVSDHIEQPGNEPDI